jgi:hypothetical protein
MHLAPQDHGWHKDHILGGFSGLVSSTCETQHADAPVNFAPSGGGWKTLNGPRELKTGQCV